MLLEAGRRECFKGLTAGASTQFRIMSHRNLHNCRNVHGRLTQNPRANTAEIRGTLGQKCGTRNGDDDQDQTHKGANGGGIAAVWKRKRRLRRCAAR
jgi:hypothetical protein